jgi:succinoglycan biosynthesis transport protein ExoP
MDLVYFFKVLYRKKWVIISLSFLAVVTAFFVLINKKPLFESVAQYSTGFTAEKVRLTDGSTGLDLFSVDVKFNNVIETMKSPQVIGMISYKLLLHDLNNPSKAYHTLTIRNTEGLVYKEVNIDNVKRILSFKILNNELLRSDDPTERQLIEYLKLYKYDYASLMENMVIERVESTDYIDIIFRSESPELSAMVVNEVGEDFLEYYKNLNSQRTEENAQSIKEMVTNQQNRVDSIGQKFLAEKLSQGDIDPTSKSASAMVTVEQMEASLAAEKGKYNEHSNQLASLNDQLKELQSEASQSNNLNSEVLQLINKKNQLVEQLSRKGGNDQTLQQQINDLITQINLKSNNRITASKLSDEIDDVKKQIDEEEALVNASSSTIDNYNAKIHEYLEMANVNPSSGIKLDVLKQQLDIENKQLENAKEKYSQVEGLLKDDPTANFIQTRIGQPAVEAESKKTMLKMALSGISMAFFMSILFVFMEIFDPAVKTPSIFSRLTKTNVVSVLNHLKLKKVYVMDIIMQDTEGKQTTIRNIYKNNIRKLRHELIESGKNIFLITSTQKKAGKSTVIEALATSFLLSKKKVLILDLNFSNNSLTKKFNAEVSVQDIADRINYSLLLDSQQLWSKTMYDNLGIIGCKEANSTPSEILYNIDMQTFLQALKKYFDFIIIEGASLNDYADSKELAHFAEAIFTVFAADESVSHTDMESFRFVASLKEKNHGVIFNNVLTENVSS